MQNLQIAWPQRWHAGPPKERSSQVLPPLLLRQLSPRLSLHLHLHLRLHLSLPHRLPPVSFL